MSDVQKRPLLTHRVMGSSRYYVENDKGEDVAAVEVHHRQGYLWVTNLHVQSPYRQKGLATTLLRRVLKEHGHRELWLEPSPYTDMPMPQHALVKLYWRHGFDEAADTPFMVREDGPAPRLCEGCEEPATCQDSQGVDLCEDCFGELDPVVPSSLHDADATE